MRRTQKSMRLQRWIGVRRASSKLLWVPRKRQRKKQTADNLQLKSNRTGQASSVLGTVRARHNELQRIEATLTELASMFADMAQIVEAQDPVVEHTEQNAIKTAEDVDKGNTEIDKANEHARRRNRLKWWCLLIVILIILAIALGVGLGIGLTKSATKTAK